MNEFLLNIERLGEKPWIVMQSRAHAHVTDEQLEQ